MKTSWERSFKTRTGTAFSFIITVSGVTITECTPSSHRRRLKWERDRLFFCLGRAAVDEVKTFQQSYLERRGAYWKAQFPILSQVRAHKHPRVQNAKWGRSTNQAQGHKKYRQKEEVGIMRGLGEIVVADCELLYGKANQHLHTFIHLVRSELFISGCYVIKPNRRHGGLLGSTIRHCNGSCSNL